MARFSFVQLGDFVWHMIVCFVFFFWFREIHKHRSTPALACTYTYTLQAHTHILYWSQFIQHIHSQDFIIYMTSKRLHSIYFHKDLKKKLLLLLGDDLFESFQSFWNGNCNYFLFNFIYYSKKKKQIQKATFDQHKNNTNLEIIWKCFIMEIFVNLYKLMKLSINDDFEVIIVIVIRISSNPPDI